MRLSEKQQQQVDAIASLVTQPDRSAIRQGIELAAALGDPQVFEGLLDGLEPGRVVSSRLANHRRYPTPNRATRFDTGSANQAWLDVAMVHLLAVSDMSMRTKVTSVALGTPRRKNANEAPPLWIGGLERLSGLTHLDLHLNSHDRDLDLGVLANFPSLTHLRIRGGVLPGPIPAMEHLQYLDGARLQFEPGARFPALRSVRGRLYSNEVITPESMPSLIELEARDGVRLAGYESLDKLWCFRGEVELLDCQRVEHLRISAKSFHAPELRHVGLLDRLSEGVDISQLETLGELKLNRTSKFTGGRFPEGTKLGDPRVVLYGPALTDLGNLGELPGLEVLIMPRVRAPISLESLRNAKDLRVLDIRNSPGITDLSPIGELANLEVLVVSSIDRFEIPERLVDCVTKYWRQRSALSQATKPV